MTRTLVDYQNNALTLAGCSIIFDKLQGLGHFNYNIMIFSLKNKIASIIWKRAINRDWVDQCSQANISGNTVPICW